MSIPVRKLQAFFGQAWQENVRMANYTTARVGGTVLGLVPVNTLEELRKAASFLWSESVPFKLIGSGSNILVSDKGYAGVILLNRCHNIKIHSQEEPPTIYAESGANLSNIARMTALRGLTGMEWAGSVPGSVGGAIYGNAGAFGSDVSQCLLTVQILTPEQGEVTLTADQMAFSYRSSILKREKQPAVILSALFKAQHSTREAAWKFLSDYAEKRRQTQPTGNSTGSTFKNPRGDYAGRLIEAVGLKGYKAEHAQFSPLHANFIVNDGQSSAQEYLSLIRLAQKRVKEQFGIELELEIEFLGDFNDEH